MRPTAKSIPFTTLTILLLATLSSAGCGKPEPRNTAAFEIEAPAPPADLERLEPGIQTQFRERYNLVLRLLADDEPSPSGLSWAFGQLGKWYMAYRQMPPARQCFAQAHELDPEEFQWLYYLGQVERLEGNLAAAEKALRKSLALRPGDVSTLIWLGEIALTEQHLEEAKNLFHQALQRDPNSAMALFGLGKALLENGDARAAIETLEQALTLQPEAGQLHYTLGLAWRQVGDLEQARTFFNRVPEEALRQVSLHFDDPLNQEVSDLSEGVQISARRATKAIARGQFNFAVSELERAVSADPQRPDTRYNLAASLLRLGRRHEAREHLERLAIDHPNHSLSRALLARLLMQENSLLQAEKHLREALELDPGAPHTNLALGDLARQQGQLDRAEKYYQQALKQAPDNVQGHFGMALILIQRQRYSDAIHQLQESLAALPGKPGLQTLLARLLAAAPEPGLRDGERAVELARGAVQQNATLTNAESLAMAYAEQGLFEDAIQWQQAVLDRLAENSAAALRVKERLDLYLHRRPCRRPWTDDERPSPLRVRRRS